MSCGLFGSLQTVDATRGFEKSSIVARMTESDRGSGAPETSTVASNAGTDAGNAGAVASVGAAGAEQRRELCRP